MYSGCIQRKTIILLIINFDRFNGITIRPHHLQEINVEVFAEQLAASLKSWKEEGRRGVWIKITSEQSDLIPIATKVSVLIVAISGFY